MRGQHEAHARDPLDIARRHDIDMLQDPSAAFERNPAVDLLVEIEHGNVQAIAQFAQLALRHQDIIAVAGEVVRAILSPMRKKDAQPRDTNPLTPTLSP